ncbi:hypothetical protein scyTo_0004466 [Scyliorhinus torazame]|uniref:Uncharacterized protein n=1 Tax=Scyliorhinus torazame TaxID=75743 RepID=A0A401NS31_SCYTO|nr:hypothetical protein [Scyliorhinus torazame]
MEALAISCLFPALLRIRMQGDVSLPSRGSLPAAHLFRGCRLAHSLKFGNGSENDLRWRRYCPKALGGGSRFCSEQAENSRRHPVNCIQQAILKT